jgi:hypothetical protein
MTCICFELCKLRIRPVGLSGFGGLANFCCRRCVWVKTMESGEADLRAFCNSLRGRIVEWQAGHPYRSVTKVARFGQGVVCILAQPESWPSKLESWTKTGTCHRQVRPTQKLVLDRLRHHKFKSTLTSQAIFHCSPTAVKLPVSRRSDSGRRGNIRYPYCSPALNRK